MVRSTFYKSSQECVNWKLMGVKKSLFAQCELMFSLIWMPSTILFLTCWTNGKADWAQSVCMCVRCCQRPRYRKWNERRQFVWNYNLITHVLVVECFEHYTFPKTTQRSFGECAPVMIISWNKCEKIANAPSVKRATDPSTQNQHWPLNGGKRHISQNRFFFIVFFDGISPNKLK